jgi:hypothetical protein
MVFKLASRVNMGNNPWNSWPPVLDHKFRKFGNKVEEKFFTTQDEVLGWLENYSKNTHQNRGVYNRNGNPDRIYAAYECTHDDPMHGTEIRDKYLYTLRLKKPKEAMTTYLNEKGIRVNCSFKRVNLGVDIENEVEYSSEMIKVRDLIYFEGVYPLTYNINDKNEANYKKFVEDVHNLDRVADREYSVSLLQDTSYNSWLYDFTKKLKMMQDYLIFMREHKAFFLEEIFSQHNELIKNILIILDENHAENDKENVKIKNLVNDPVFFDGECFQIRYENTFISWHRNYIDVILNHKLIPSNNFCSLVINFDLSDFEKQFQSIENLLKVWNNLEQLFGDKKKIQKSVEIISNRKKNYLVKSVKF